jgi:hypothetical protein
MLPNHFQFQAFHRGCCCDIFIKYLTFAWQGEGLFHCERTFYIAAFWWNTVHENAIGVLFLRRASCDFLELSLRMSRELPEIAAIFGGAGVPHTWNK